MSLSWVDSWEVLRLFQQTSEQLWWKVDDEGNITWFVMCSDVFAWGTADAEEIETIEDLLLLRDAKAECDALAARMKKDGDSGWASVQEYWPTLWAARKRAMRPQGALYKYLPEQMWGLFDAVGPERRVGFGNPAPVPQKGQP